MRLLVPLKEGPDGSALCRTPLQARWQILLAIMHKNAMVDSYTLQYGDFLPNSFLDLSTLTWICAVLKFP